MSLGSGSGTIIITEARASHGWHQVKQPHLCILNLTHTACFLVDIYPETRPASVISQ